MARGCSPWTRPALEIRLSIRRMAAMSHDSNPYQPPSDIPDEHIELNQPRRSWNRLLYGSRNHWIANLVLVGVFAVLIALVALSAYVIDVGP